MDALRSWFMFEVSDEFASEPEKSPSQVTY
jgi:hypothetical protein